MLLFWRGEKKGAGACGVMSCITASVHNPSHLMSFSAHSLFNTVRSISRWRKGPRRRGGFCSDRHEELQDDLRGIYVCRSFNRAKKRLYWGCCVGQIKHWGCDSPVRVQQIPQGAVWMQESTFQAAPLPLSVISPHMTEDSRPQPSSIHSSRGLHSSRKPSLYTKMSFSIQTSAHEISFPPSAVWPFVSEHNGVLQPD